VNDSSAPAEPIPPDPSIWRRGVAAVAAWLAPGLGHWILGERRRARWLAAGILGLYLAGLLVGGVTVVNHREPGPDQRNAFSYWFLGQALIGPSIAIDLTQKLTVDWIVNGEPPPPDAQPLVEPVYGHMREIGVLYTALAGLLNLLAILDVIYYNPARRSDRSTAEVEEHADANEPGLLHDRTLAPTRAQYQDQAQNQAQARTAKRDRTASHGDA